MNADIRSSIPRLLGSLTLLLLGAGPVEARDIKTIQEYCNLRRGGAFVWSTDQAPAPGCNPGYDIRERGADPKDYKTWLTTQIRTSVGAEAPDGASALKGWSWKFWESEPQILSQIGGCDSNYGCLAPGLTVDEFVNGKAGRSGLLGRYTEWSRRDKATQMDKWTVSDANEGYEEAWPSTWSEICKEHEGSGDFPCSSAHLRVSNGNRDDLETRLVQLMPLPDFAKDTSTGTGKMSPQEVNRLKENRRKRIEQLLGTYDAQQRKTANVDPESTEAGPEIASGDDPKGAKEKEKEVAKGDPSDCPDERPTVVQETGAIQMLCIAGPGKGTVRTPKKSDNSTIISYLDSLKRGSDTLSEWGTAKVKDHERSKKGETRPTDERILTGTEEKSWTTDSGVEVATDRCDGKSVSETLGLFGQGVGAESCLGLDNDGSKLETSTFTISDSAGSQASNIWDVSMNGYLDTIRGKAKGDADVEAAIAYCRKHGVCDDAFINSVMPGDVRERWVAEAPENGGKPRYIVKDGETIEAVDDPDYLVAFTRWHQAQAKGDAEGEFAKKGFWAWYSEYGKGGRRDQAGKRFDTLSAEEGQTWVDAEGNPVDTPSKDAFVNGEIQPKASEEPAAGEEEEAAPQEQTPDEPKAKKRDHIEGTIQYAGDLAPSD